MRRARGLFCIFVGGCFLLDVAACGFAPRAHIATACAVKKQKKCTLSFIFKDLTTKERILSNLPGGRKNILLACHILSQLRPPRKRFNGGICRTLKIRPKNGNTRTFAKYYVTHKRQFFAFSAAFYRRHTAGVRTVVRARHPLPLHTKQRYPKWRGVDTAIPRKRGPWQGSAVGGSPNCGSAHTPVPHKRDTRMCVSFMWWEGVDSNHRSRRRQIYSLMHLATLQPARIKFLPRPHRWTGIWSWRLESNPQPADYKSAALPVELRQHA